MKLVRIFAKRDYIKVKYRLKMIDIIKACAAGEIKIAIEETEHYLKQLSREEIQIKSTIQKIEDSLNETLSPLNLKRQQVSDFIHVSIDSLVDWERNGFLKVGRQNNNYRFYTEKEIQLLKVIKVLKAGQYGSQIITRIMITPYQAGEILTEELEAAKEIAKEASHYLGQLQKKEKMR